MKKKVDAHKFGNLTDEQKAELLANTSGEKAEALAEKKQERMEAHRRFLLWKQENPDATAEEKKEAAKEAGLKKRAEARRRWLFWKKNNAEKPDFESMTEEEKEEVMKKREEARRRGFFIKKKAKEEGLEKREEARRRQLLWKKQNVESDSVNLGDIAPGVTAEDMEANEEVKEAVKKRRAWFFWQTQRNDGERAPLPEEGKDAGFFKGLKSWVNGILSN